jgi:aminopeptidase
MTDPCLSRLADLIVGYSLDLEAGTVVRLDSLDVAAPLVVELYRSALAAGAHPYASLTLDGVAEELVALGSDEQLEYLSPVQWAEIEHLGALVTIWAETNTRSMSRAQPDRQSRYIAAQRQLSKRRWERISAGDMRWCGTLFPTHAHAQDAGMALREYEAFVYAACHVDEADPATHWRSTSAALRARADELEQVRELRVLGPDTDLRLSVEGRRWLAADGHLNMPDGEVFTSPVETSTDGEIRFTFPAHFGGRTVEDVHLRFSGGRVVEAEAAGGGDYLRSLLDMDEGARVLGEVAFGLNYEIDRFTSNILFDEKIGGTMHFALGAAFTEAGGANTSGLHWDMICDLREEGEVYADGELVWRAGRFLREPEPVRG